MRRGAAKSSLKNESFSVERVRSRIPLNDGPSILTVAGMGGVCPIVAYRPKPGRESELLELVRSRVPILRREGLATERRPIILRAKDGTIVEVSEWTSAQAIEAAHRNPNVLALWHSFFELCDCVPLNSLAEAAEMFACFEPLDE